MVKPHWRWLVAAGLVSALLGAAAVWRSGPVEVTIVHPRRGAAVELVYATGFAEAAHPVIVAARTTAPVEAVLVEEGERVRRGQALLTLDDSDLRAAYAQARALSRGASSAEARAVALFEKGWVTQSARDAAVFNGQAARAAERLAAARLGQNVVRAGIDGVVVKRDIEPGELAVPTRTLMLLGDPARARISATVDERDIPRIAIGQKAMLASDAWPGRTIAARVSELTPAGDPDQRAFRVRLRPDSARLPLGMSLEVNIVTREARGAVLLPTSAIADDAVWTMIEGRARRHPVTVGIRGQDNVEVRGIAPSAFVIDNPVGLRDGTRVKARQ